MSTNGFISFGMPFFRITAGGNFDSVSSPPIIAPFWDDININNGGTIYYRQDNTSIIAEEVRQEIVSLYPDAGSFRAELVFVATWDRVAAFSPQYSGRVNTFQAVIASDGTQTFVRFNYGSVEWGSLFTLIGVSLGDGFNYITHPASLSSSVTFIANSVVTYRIDGKLNDCDQCNIISVFMLHVVLLLC